MADSIAIGRVIEVSGGGCRQGNPWRVQAVDTIEGQDYVRLSASDSGLSRFMNGHGLNSRWGKPPSHALGVVQTSNRCHCGFGQTSGARSQRRRSGTSCCSEKYKQTSKNMASLDTLPKIVTMILPGQYEMRAKSDLDLGACVYVELAAENLRYLRDMAQRMQSEQELQPP